MVGAQLRQSAINFGAHERGIAEQLDDVLPDERLHRVLPDWAIGTAAALRESIGVHPRTAIIGEPAARGACRVPVEGVAAQLTDQQALEGRGLLGVPGRELPVLFEAFLDQRELSRDNQSGHRNLDPLLPRTRAGAYRMGGNAAALPQAAVHALPLSLVGFLETGRALIRRVAQHVPDRALIPPRLTGAGADPCRGQPAGEGAQRGPFFGIPAEHLAHHDGLGLDHLIPRGRSLGFAHVAIAERRPGQGVHQARLGAMSFTPPRALTDLRLLVLCDHALELEQ